MSAPAAQRRDALVELYREASGCPLCRLSETRNSVVFGAGDANADLMFIGEAPGAEEDRRGLPFVGRAGKLLDQLLEEIGTKREDVFITNVLKCLRYTALVQLGDGSWERVGRLVRSRYSGEVMSVDDDGRLVRRRVIGWHATPVGSRRVYRLSYRSAKRAGAGQVNVQLTGDHPVLTRRGYVRVDELVGDDELAIGQGLSPVAYDVTCGTLLGDGSLNRVSSYLQFGHSERQREYAAFKAELLEELRPRAQAVAVAAVAGGPRVYGAVQVRTLAHRGLRLLRGEFYKPAKIVPEWIRDQLNERMLAIWFMDDGYLRIRPPRRPSAQIATEGFDASDIQVLLKGLSRLGLPAKADSAGRINFSVETTEHLSRLIAPFVPPAMRWKLHPEIAAKAPFSPELWRAEPPDVMFDQVDVQDVTEAGRTDKTFFCIDVEETHNFVTAGGVVHNCRPPGNRDPQPDEIEACWPYLERQIQLIEPRVIATLGNFATKKLTGSSVGITRVRGTPQVHELAGRSLFVFPLLHPAAALRTPSLVETLREDFAKLPGLIAEQPQDRERPELEREPAERSRDDPESQLDLFA